MKLTKSLLFATALCTMLVLSGRPANAQDPAHPAYLRALSDLRLMRTYLDRMTPSERIDDDQAKAIEEIDTAIRQIREAAIDDGKDPNWRAPIDAHLTPADRWRHAREAGTAAYHDLNGAADDNFANGLKHKAQAHITYANHIVDSIMRQRHYE